MNIWLEAGMHGIVI